MLAYTYIPPQLVRVNRHGLESGECKGVYY